MRWIVQIARAIIGVLFIISGLIKINDPMGFAFKLQDYFDPSVLNLPFLIPYALSLAIIIVIFEVLIGVMLLLGVARKFTLWSLIGMILFFTFLTFYSAYFNKVTDCGCFGDAIPLNPWQSFYKDVILLFLIGIVYFGRRFIQPILNKRVRAFIVFLSFVLSISIVYYVLGNLPIIDFRPYKIGANIQEGMAFPEDAPEAVYNYHWWFEVDGKEEVITTQGDYPTVEGEFLRVDTEQVSEGYEPPIHDFSIEKDGEDYTDTFLNTPNLVVIVAYDLDLANDIGMTKIGGMAKKAQNEGFEVIALSASNIEKAAAVKEEFDLPFDFYFCDETALKTIVRSVPGVLVLQEGTIVEKQHWTNLKKLDLKIEK